MLSITDLRWATSRNADPLGPAGVKSAMLGSDVEDMAVDKVPIAVPGVETVVSPMFLGTGGGSSGKDMMYLASAVSRTSSTCSRSRTSSLTASKWLHSQQHDLGLETYFTAKTPATLHSSSGQRTFTRRRRMPVSVIPRHDEPSEGTKTMSCPSHASSKRSPYLTRSR